MVNRGRSGACVTCKERRVKCDEEKPECSPCQRRNILCGGYKTKPRRLKFIDQNHIFSHAFVKRRAFGVQDQAVMPVLRPLTEPDTAVPFFLRHYANLGRYKGSARGFFEILIPIYRSQRTDSAFSLAVSALASEVLSLWQHKGGGFQSRKPYAQAMARLRSTIQDPTECGKPATLLAVLALQLYENVAAIYELRLATSVHHNGAMSLLPYSDLDRENGVTGAYIRRFMLHTEIASALRQKRPVQKVAYSWIGSKALLAVPDNPSSTLDVIGASVAELQARYMRLGAHNGPTDSLQGVLEELRAVAKGIDGQLLAWTRSVPEYWRPIKFTSGQEIDASIPTYRSICEVYHSCQIANIWNLWRCLRLVLVKIIISSSNTSLGPFHPANYPTSGEMKDLVEYKRTLQELVDSVCHSVPFYLGNRTELSAIADFNDPDVLLPSYHSLPSGDERRFSDQIGDPMMSKDEHKHHLVAQGPWHAMSPLSRLLTLFSEEHGKLMVSFLRPGQHEWISEQFLRVSTLLHLQQATSSDRKAENLARAVRKGAIFMSGP